MRKIFIYIIACSFFIPGCKKDVLDITPDGRITLDDVFKNEKTTEAYLNTVYSGIPSYFWKYGFFDFLASYSDECYAYGGATIAWAGGSLTPGNNPLTVKQERGKNSDHYPVFWAGIRDANVFLANIDGAPITNLTNKNRFKAEAKLLRAFYYWELIKQFGPMPYVSKPFDNTFDFTSLVRPTFQTIVDSIVKDCNEAISEPNLPIRITVEAERGRFSKAVAYAIKSEALLYNASPLWNPGNDGAKWQGAATASKEALTALTSGGTYQLFPDYGDYFIGKSDINTSPRDKETILEIPEDPDGVFSIINSIPSKPGMFKVGACPTQEMVDAYGMQATGEPAILGYEDADHLIPIINSASGYDPNDPYKGRDPRFYATVWYNGAQYDNVGGQIHTIQTFSGGADQLVTTPYGWSNTRTGYYLRKFIDPRLQSGQGQDCRWKKYRLAEIYLNYAEAENEANGPTAGAYEAVNTVRRRASMPDLPSGLSKDAFRDRVRNERRVELAIEEHRFWDVRRWKILDKTDKLVTGLKIKFKTDDVSVADGDFESNSSNWIYFPGSSRSSASSYSGAYAANISGTSGGLVAQVIQVQPNSTYMVSAWVKVTSGAGVVGAQDYGGDPVGSASTSPEWTKVSATFTTGSSNTTAVVGSLWGAGSTGFVDDFEIVHVTYKRFLAELRNSWQDKFLIFPIPTRDASIVPNFQNPGW